jgi:probable rRNA maturation factor
VSRVEVVASGLARPRWSPRLSRFCRAALKIMGHADWEVSILLCDDETMRSLNKKYRGTDSSTDVLSFRQGDEESPGCSAAVGDVAISLDTLRANAGKLGLSEDEELKRLAVHGLLHLAGMDHGRGRSGAMLTLQEKLLRDLAGQHIVSSRSHR